MFFVDLRGRKGRTTTVAVTKYVVVFHTFAYYCGRYTLLIGDWEWVFGRDLDRNPNGCYGAY